MKSFGKSTLKVQPYFAPQQLKKIFIPVVDGAAAARPKKNVVIIILESFSKNIWVRLMGKKAKRPFLIPWRRKVCFLAEPLPTGKNPSREFRLFWPACLR